MDLFNVTTRRKETIDNQDALHKAILSGSHAFSQGKKITVTSPDGQLGTIPSENAIDAIKSGYKIETNSQRAVREYVEDNKGILGTLKVGLGQFADEAAIGLPELIFDKTGDPLEVAKKNALKKEHDLANTLGGIGGFGASLFVGGPLWKAGTKAGNSVASHIAQKIAVETGEQAAKKSIRNAAASIAGKTAGGLTEGAIVSMPHAITEAALGDPEAAANAMIAGAGFGALFGGATGLGKEFLGLGKKVSDETARIIGEKKLTLEKINRKLAKTITGVDEDDLLYTLRNPERIKNAPTVEALKDEIDSVYRKVELDSDLATEALENTKKRLDEAYQAKRAELSQTRAPQELADELVASLDRQKSVLGQMSEEADEILANSAAFIPKKKVIKMLNQIDNTVVPLSDESVAASKAIKRITARVDDLYGQSLDGVELREVLQEVRKDIKWNQMAGEFNDTANKLRKNFQKIVSDSLKKQSPEYAEQMAQMSKLSDALNKMSKSFGDREKAARTLTGMLGKGKEVKRETLAEFSNITGEDFFTRFKQFADAKEMGEQIKAGKDLRMQLFPGLTSEVESLSVKARNAKELLNSFSKINPNVSQASIKNMARKEPDIMKRRAFEKLEELTGTPFLQLIKDRNVADAFQKNSTQGSRKVNLGALFGWLIGDSPEAVVAGGTAGAVTDNYGGQILKSFIDQNPSMAGLLFVEKAMKKTATEVDKIPGILTRMAEKAKKGPEGVSKRFIAIDAIYRLTQDTEPTKKEKENPGEQLAKIGDKINSWLSDPVSYQNMIGKFTTPLSEGGAPNIAQGLSIGAQKALMYLQAELPKPPAPSSPFAPKITWNPSDSELTKFAQIVQVAENPFVVLDELESGTLTSNHMDALKALYPTVYKAVQEKIVETAVNDPKPMTYQQRIKLSILADMPLDESMNDKQILSLQKNFTAQDGEEDPGGEQFNTSQSMKLAKANLTTMQSAVMQ